MLLKENMRQINSFLIYMFIFIGAFKGLLAESSDCQIPGILHGSLKEGILGDEYFNFMKFRYERKYAYKTISVGHTVPSSKVLYLFCEDDRSFEGTSQHAVPIECFKGRWTSDPVCLRLNCSRDSLTYPGIGKALKPFYFDGEVLNYTCDHSRYRKPAGHNGQIRCINGTWTGDSPFCTPANCTNPPPSIDHGKVKNFTMLHGAVAKYVCEDPYILVSDSLVQCSFGKWKGQPPQCRDDRCYLSNLKLKSNVSPHTQTVTSSGDKLNVICDEGYSANPKLPVCEKGVWKENTNESLCKESGCQIPSILHGALKDLILGNGFFSFRTFRYERKYEYKTIPMGDTVPSSKILYLFCEDGHSFQGTSQHAVQIECFKGRWSSDPVCLGRGQIYTPTTIKPWLSSLTTISLPPVTIFRERYSPSETASTKEFSLSTIPSTVLTSLAKEEAMTTAVVMDPITESVEDQCTCYYPLNDRSVVAHANGKRLSLGDKVQSGDSVIFRCLLVGYHLLIGPDEITCADCQPWNSNDFPSCTEPQKGNVVIIFDENVKVLEDGTIEINKGQNVNFSCIAVETAEYPMWNVPSSERISFQSESTERKHLDDVLYITQLTIQDTDYNHEGIYHCFLKSNEERTFYVAVIDPDEHCPEFPDDNDLIIIYEKDRRESSKVFFSCRNKNLELVGEPVSQCLWTKEWSAPLPYCAVRCKELKDSDYLTVQYTNNLEVGSMALFHCFFPGVRIGETSAECLKNGSWSHPPPSCKVSANCPAFPAAKELNISYTKGLFVDSIATFRCSSKKTLVGNTYAVCKRDGVWSYPLPSCESAFSGCALERDPFSDLSIEPEKPSYKAGESITLSCPAYKELIPKTELIMCLGNKWSDTIPECEELDFKI